MSFSSHEPEKLQKMCIIVSFFLTKTKLNFNLTLKLKD